MTIRDLGNPLGLARSGYGKQLNSVTFAVDITAGTTYFNLPFVPSNPAQLEIEIQQFNGNAGWMKERAFYIPAREDFSFLSLKRNASDYFYSYYDALTNRVVVVVSAGILQGRLTVKLIERTVKNYAKFKTWDGLIDTKTPLPFSIVDPSKAYILTRAANIFGIGSVNIGSYVPDTVGVLTQYAWHWLDGTGTPAVAVLSDSVYIVSGGGHAAISLIEFY